MSISLLQYSVTGDCENTNSGEVFLQVTGDTPPFVVSCISSPCSLPTSALTAPYEYYVTGLSGGTFFLEIKDGGGGSIIQSVYISSGTTATIDSSHTTCGLDNGTVTGFTSGVYGYNIDEDTEELVVFNNNCVPNFDDFELNVGINFEIFCNG